MGFNKKATMEIEVDNSDGRGVDDGDDKIEAIYVCDLRGDQSVGAYP